MNSRFKTLLALFLLFTVSGVNSQVTSILVLGDIHYDLLDDHDMTWLKTKPDDMRQVTQEYTVYTSKYWDAFMKVVARTVNRKDKPVDAIVQTGDFSEGLAGSPSKAGQMAKNTMKVIDQSDVHVPWIMVKGNHDITGPGAPEAFMEYWLPEIRKQTKKPEINGANYSWSTGNVQIVCLDPWDNSVDMPGFLDKSLSESKAAFKFVAIHEPVIPVTERCWHVLRKDQEKREKLLEIIARNKAIVLCGHLHRYSVVKRNTANGPIIQVMTNSVVRDSNYLKPGNVIRKYGPSLVDSFPMWEPQTSDQRRKWLSEESSFVSYYSQTDLPGYSVITINQSDNSIILEYFAAFGKEPFETVNLTRLP